MPSCFQATYGTMVVAIIDCYEIKIETPSHLVAKSSMYMVSIQTCKCDPLSKNPTCLHSSVLVVNAIKIHWVKTCAT